MQLNINSKAVVKFTNTLEKLHRSALPSAIGGALNDAAFDVKTNTMPKHARNEFEERQPNFFKANSRFEKATGFDVNSMKATVGFIEGGLKGGNNFAVRDLEQQEEGGTITHKAFIPMKGARRNNRGVVRSNARIEQLKNIIKVEGASAKNAKEKFVKSMIFAGKGGFVLSKGILWKINSVKRLGNGNHVFNKTALYSVQSKRSVKVQGRHFMRDASLESANRMESFFINQAKRQFQKFK
jgi:hypothetical protein